MEKITSNEKRYLEFLTEVWEKSGTIFGMNDLMNEYRVYLNTSKVLQTAKLLKKEKGKGMSKRWVWKSIKPNIKMVRELFDNWDRLVGEGKKGKEIEIIPEPEEKQTISIEKNGVKISFEGTKTDLSELIKTL